MFDQERIRQAKAVGAAQAAFWRELAAAYPESTTGDVPACTLSAFDAATDSAAATWVRHNVPKSYAIATVHVVTGDSPTDAFETFTASARAAGALFVTGPRDISALQIGRADFDVSILEAGDLLTDADESS